MQDPSCDWTAHRVQFDVSQEDQVYQSLRQPVRVTGMAKINPHTGKIDELRIEKIAPVEPLLTGGRDFFTERSIEQLAEIRASSR